MRVGKCLRRAPRCPAPWPWLCWAPGCSPLPGQGRRRRRTAPSRCPHCCAPPHLHPAPPRRALPRPPGLYQRRVAAVRLLGELYNYKLVNSHVVFATLHLLLAYGHEAGTPPEVAR